jgi:hypothetical protein
MPVAAAPVYTLEQLAHAGAYLGSIGKLNDCQSLLNNKYGVPSLYNLPPDRYGEMATDLRTLGAQI